MRYVGELMESGEGCEIIVFVEPRGQRERFPIKGRRAELAVPFPRGASFEDWWRSPIHIYRATGPSKIERTLPGRIKPRRRSPWGARAPRAGRNDVLNNELSRGSSALSGCDMGHACVKIAMNVGTQTVDDGKRPRRVSPAVAGRNVHGAFSERV